MLRRRFLAMWGISPVMAAAGKPPVVGFAGGTYGMKTLATAEALRLLTQIGYDGVELALMPGWAADPAKLAPAERQDLRRMLEENGLALPAFLEVLPLTGTPQKRAYNLERLKLAASLAHELAPASPPCIDTILGLKSADWDGAKGRMLDELHDWAKVAESGDIIIGVKLHAGQALDTPAKALWLMQQLATPRLRLIYDYSHLSLEGFALEASLRELLPYIAFISVKDARGTPGHHEYLLPGDGNIDYVGYFRTLKQVGYRGFVGVEVSAMIHQKPGYDPAATARICYERLAPAFQKAGLDRPARRGRTRN
jgi:sugar phosphate isomerase/epimerase